MLRILEGGEIFFKGEKLKFYKGGRILIRGEMGVGMVETFFKHVPYTSVA